MSKTPKNFAHLHQHTSYSLLDGAARIKDLMSWVKEVSPEKPVLAMTDHGNMHGAVEFYKEAIKQEVKPIIGFEAYITAGSRFEKKKPSNRLDGGYFHLTLLAQNFKGYQNLSKLSSLGYTEGFYTKPRIDREILNEYSEGVIALSGCLGAQIPRTILDRSEEAGEEILNKYLDIFGDRFFIEIQNHGIDEQQILNPILKGFANKYGLGMVATNDGHYVKKEDAKAHEALLAIQTKTVLSDPNRFKFECDEFYVKSPDEMAKVIPEKDYPSALSNSMVIADMCNLELPIGDKQVYQMPEIKVPENRSLAEQLRIQSYRGLIDRYDEVNDELFETYLRVFSDEKPKNLEETLLIIAKEGEKGRQELKKGQTFSSYIYPHLDKLKEANLLSESAFTILERVEYELGVIIGMGFPDYFLIVADFISWAKAQKIAVGPGRGSGAGSIVAYALHITNIDPLVYDLLFERFLNPDRVSMPDFDIDFSDTRRNEVIDYVRQKYGNDRVAQIATFGTMASKAAIKDAARVLEAPYADADKVSKLIPTPFGRSTPIAKAMEQIPEIRQAYDEGAKEFMDVAMALEGLTRHASVHAAGVIIARNPITELAPVFKSGDGPLVCQYDMSSIEELGLIKMDFLGLRTLSFIEAAVKIIKDTRGVELVPDNFPLDDKKTFELLARGESAGVFQFEGAGMVDTLKRLRPKRIQELFAITSLYRPGPMDNIPTYIRRHHGLEEVSYHDFPKSQAMLEPILKETYGIPVYQEQIMQIVRAVANYSLGEADVLRRAMGKKKKDVMEKHRKIFSDGAAKNGVSKQEADKLFDLLEKFADYGFNKSHAAAYSTLSFQTAYIKAHFPLEFMAALLTVERANSDKVAEYVNDAKHMGIEVLAPDVNVSNADFTPDKGVVRFGLYGIKNLGDHAVEHILEERKNGKFKDLWDFCKRVDSHTVNKRGLEYLIKAGAMDSFGSRSQLLANYEMAMKWGSAQKAQAESGQMGLFATEEVKPPKMLDAKELSELEQLQMEKEAMGLYISSHPMNSYPGLSASASCTINNLEDWYNQQKLSEPHSGRIKVALAGILQNVSKRTTKRGNMYARFALADQTGSREIMAFSRTYEQISGLLVNDAPVILIAELSDDEDQMRVVADRLYHWNDKDSLPQVIVLQFDLDDIDADELLDFRSQLDEIAGMTSVKLELKTKDSLISYQTGKLRLDKSRLEEIKAGCPWLRTSVRADVSRFLEPSKQDEKQRYYKKTVSNDSEVPF